MYLPFKLFKFIFCTLLLINSILCYDPAGRTSPNSVIIDDRLLIFSGYTNNNDYTFELFYLDLSKPFDNNNITWTLIPEGSLPDYPTSTWSTPELGDVVPPRQNMKGVIDNSGIIYIFGGYNATNLIINEGYLFNDMNILRTDSKTWTTLSISENLPIQCAEYTANILSNGIIVYVGGIEKVSVDANFTLVNMKEIKLFDTNKYEWSYINAVGDEIDPRWYFSSVLTPDGYIIIFGGTTFDHLTGVSPRLAMLDTNKNPFEWSIPSSSKANSPPYIWRHVANLYYDFMIISFGMEINTQLYSSQVYLYNIKSNKWVTTYSPPSLIPKPSTTTSGTSTATVNPATNSPTKKPSNSLAIGLGTGIGVAVLVSCIFIATFVFRKARRSRQRLDILEIPGSNQFQ
ncbi:hypothetical protein Glove_461g28 [Diversispora epigaea]|uniref:Galactose oxidase n=1 Tax=Diversispora epigaea TaxID=1348612 RepID=A0A397GNK5_9GLOM|nr:hypothetical protein Glove_461g28 [Diversispora epigaea]